MDWKSVLVSLDPLSLPRLDGISAYAKEHKWALILEDRIPRGMDLRRVDGAIAALRGRPEQIKRARWLWEIGKPVVDLTVARPDVRLPRVVSDHRAIGAMAARHFLERGFEHFAWYSSGWSNVHKLRYAGYAKALKGHVVPKLTSLAELSQLPTPLAALAYDEIDAGYLIDECRALRRDVPGDVAVLGIGNDPFLCENAEVAISAVDQNLAEAAREGCALLDRLMADAKRDVFCGKPPTILIPPAGVISRASTSTIAHPEPTVRAALVYIHKHLARAFGAEEVAASLNVPRSSLDHLFAEKVGHAVGREILNQRMSRAKRLLKDDAVKISAIAEICGFCNASYFTNVFKRETGIMPKTWRKRGMER